jgi:hypothetical protein
MSRSRNDLEDTVNDEPDQSLESRAPYVPPCLEPVAGYTVMTGASGRIGDFLDPTDDLE